jgi:hypothetical protein
MLKIGAMGLGLFALSDEQTAYLRDTSNERQTITEINHEG